MATTTKRATVSVPSTVQTPSSQPRSRAATAVDDAVEQLLIKLNRAKFTASDERSMTIVAARGALRVFTVMLEKDKPRSVDRVIANVTRICQTYFSRAPAFRLVLANVTRMVLLGIREAGAHVSRAALAAAADAAEGDLSAMDQQDEGGDDDEGMSMMPSSPTRTSVQRSMSFSAYHHGHFPAVDTNDFSEQESPATATAADGMDEPKASNSSFVDRAPTPLTEATIPRIASHFERTRYNRGVNLADFRSRALAALHDMEDHLESIMEGLTRHAVDHVADGDTILTFGSSHTTMRFLAEAAQAGRRFRVIALAASPHGNADTLAQVLAPHGIPVDVVPDSECYNVVPRCSKVLLSTEGVLANGGLLAPTGSRMICIVARVFSVEIVVVATTLKISPYYPSDAACSSLVKMSASEAKEMLWTTFSDPSRVLPHEHVHSVIAANGMESPLVFNPSVEYVPPEHVSILVTDSGEFTPAFIHRYLKEQYHPEDTHL